MIPTFAAPAFAWLLLLGVPVVVFHMRRRRTITVPSVFLFVPNAAPGAPADHRWARPRLSVPLALQLSFLVLVTAAAMGPRWGVESSVGHRILVLDASASMRAVDVEGSRFGAAQADLVRSVDALDEAAVVTVVLAGPVPRFLAVRSSDPDAVREAVRAAAPTDGRSDWARVASMASGLLRADPAARVAVLTDPAGAPEARVALASAAPEADLEVVEFGGPAANVALTSLYAVDEGASVDGARLEVRVAGTLVGYGGADWRGAVEVRDAASGTLLADVAAAVRSGEAARFQVDVALAGPTELVVGVAGGDVLAADDRATLIVGGPRAVSVLVVSPEGDGGSVWAEALRAVPGTTVTLANGAADGDVDRYDLVVADRVVLEPHPRTSVVRVAGPRADGAEGSTSELVPTEWLGAHRLSDGVDWRTLEVPAGVEMAASPGGVVVVGADGRPVVRFRVTEFGLDVDVAFGPDGSNAFETSIGPAFVANIVRMVEPNAGRVVDAPCRVGAPCALPLRALLLDGPGIGPDGRSVALPRPFADSDPLASTGGPRRFPAGTEVDFVPLLAGTYRFGTAADGSGHRVAVHPAVWPEADLGVGSGAEGGVAALPVGTRRIAAWRWLVAAALVVVVADGVGALRGMGRGAGGRHRRWPWAVATLATAASFLVLGWAEAPFPQRAMEGSIVRVVEVRAPEAAADADRESREGDGVDRRVGRFEVGLAGRAPAASEAPATGASGGSWNALDLEAAIDAAIASAPPGVPLRVDVVASGVETQGSLVRRFAEWVASGTVFDVGVPPEAPIGDARVVDVFVPRTVHEGVPFPLELVLDVEAEATVSLRIDRNGEPWLEETIALPSGRSRVAVEAVEPVVGASVYGATVAVPGDPLRGNDVGGVVVAVDRAPEVAIVTEEVGWAMLLGQALNLQGIEVTYLDPRTLAMDVGAWLPFDVVVLHDVPAIALHTRQQESLTEWVRTHGGGVLVLGGEHAYGPGGYYGTPLERLSPLSSLIPRERADVAVAFVIDRSGSMQQAVGTTSRLDIAREATWEAIQLLDERSEVVIVVFDSYSTLLHPLAAVDRVDPIRTSLDLLAAGGGTSIYPALVQAFGELRRSEASQRHIVLLTDGLSQAGDFEGIMRDIAGAGITLSAISAGIGTAYERLQRLVELGNGTYYDTNDFQAVPGIMSQEMLLLTSDPIEEGAFVPTWAERGDGVASTWPDAVPTLEGIVRTTAKPSATVHLVGPDELPVFASWRFGAGRVAAFAGHGAGPWDLDWIARPAYPALWANVVRQLDARATPTGLDVVLTARGDELSVIADLLDGAGRPVSGASLRARLVAPVDGSAHVVDLVELAAGRYAAHVPVSATGPFVVEVRDELGSVEAGEAFAYRAYPAALQYGPSGGVLHDLARATGGRVGGALEATSLGDPTWRGVRDRIPWLVLSTLAFLVFLALRYVRAKPG